MRDRQDFFVRTQKNVVLFRRRNEFWEAVLFQILVISRVALAFWSSICCLSRRTPGLTVAGLYPRVFDGSHYVARVFTLLMYYPAISSEGAHLVSSTIKFFIHPILKLVQLFLGTKPCRSARSAISTSTAVTTKSPRLFLAECT